MPSRPEGRKSSADPHTDVTFPENYSDKTIAGWFISLSLIWRLTTLTPYYLPVSVNSQLRSHISGGKLKISASGNNLFFYFFPF